MPPRHTYWTILFGDKPTAFRSATQEELLPTYKQIQSRHPDAVMMLFPRGRGGSGRAGGARAEAGMARQLPRAAPGRVADPRPQTRVARQASRAAARVERQIA